MERQRGLAGKLGRVESLGISKVDQTMLARLMESQIWHQLACSVVGFCKETVASACPDARYFGLSLYTTLVFQAAALVRELRGSECE